MNSREKVILWIGLRKSPFDKKNILKACNVSYSTAAKALEEFHGRIKCYSCHVGNGNFRDTFFPLDWTDEQCWAYMDSQTKSGKSKAHLYLFASKEILRVSDDEQSS